MTNSDLTPLPTGMPSSRPTGQPTGQPSSRPSLQPTMGASKRPTGQPTSRPSSRVVILGAGTGATLGNLSTQSVIIIFSSVGAAVLCLFILFTWYFQFKYLNKEGETVHSLVEENFDEDEVVIDDGHGRKKLCVLANYIYMNWSMFMPYVEHISFSRSQHTGHYYCTIFRWGNR